MSQKTRTIHNAILTEDYEQVQADLAALDASLTAIDAALGAYYTPPAILSLVDPALGSGSYLVYIVGNPPYAD